MLKEIYSAETAEDHKIKVFSDGTITFESSDGVFKESTKKPKVVRAFKDIGFFIPVPFNDLHLNEITVDINIHIFEDLKGIEELDLDIEVKL